ncbi:MAG: hypothetical protein JW870_19660 [Candidatus Delongbacteria bacterium]|nr:hypothetical protein [Candidatus Delongbacteria bacterium]
MSEVIHGVYTRVKGEYMPLFGIYEGRVSSTVEGSQMLPTILEEKNSKGQ